MIPVGVTGVKKRPYATWLLIVLNTLIFFYFYLQGDVVFHVAIKAYGLAPIDLLRGRKLHALITSMFMHGDLVHLLSNMLFLYVFGGAVEARMGTLRFTVFYLACGFAASFMHSLVELFSFHPLNIPCIGASGAISGILGAYLILFPFSFVNVMTLTLLGLPFIIPIPAVLFLAFWFLFQLWMGFLSLHLPYFVGVAFWAHIGGFITGALLSLPLKRRRYVVRSGKIWYEVPIHLVFQLASRQIHSMGRP